MGATGTNRGRIFALIKGWLEVKDEFSYGSTGGMRQVLGCERARLRFQSHKSAQTVNKAVRPRPMVIWLVH